MLPDYKLDTPEAISISYDLAGIGTRFLAAAIDFLIWIGLAIILVIGAAALGSFGALARSVAAILFTTLAFVILYGYYIIFEGVWHGQTPGKRAIKIRVIKRSGRRIGFTESAIRNVVRIVDFLPAFYGVGVVTMFISHDWRRLGDYAAGTIVVRERPAQDLARSLAPLRPALRLPELGEVDPDELSWDLRALRPPDLAVMRRYLERAPDLRADARETVGNELGARIAPMIGARMPLNPTQFIERVLYLADQAPAETDGPS